MKNWYFYDMIYEHSIIYTLEAIWSKYDYWHGQAVDDLTQNKNKQLWNSYSSPQKDKRRRKDKGSRQRRTFRWKCWEQKNK